MTATLSPAIGGLKAPFGYRKLDSRTSLSSAPEGAAMPKEITSDEALARAKSMSERYVKKGPYEFFPLPEIVDEVQGGLAKNLIQHGHLYCP